MPQYSKNDFEIGQNLIVCHDTNVADRMKSYNKGVIKSLGYKFITVDVDGEEVKFDYDLKESSRFPIYIAYISYKEFKEDIEYAKMFSKLETALITSRYNKKIPLEKIRKMYNILVGDSEKIVNM